MFCRVVPGLTCLQCKRIRPHLRGHHAHNSASLCDRSPHRGGLWQLRPRDVEVTKGAEHVEGVIAYLKRSERGLWRA